MSYDGTVYIYRYENNNWTAVETIRADEKLSNSSAIDLNQKRFVDVDFDGDLDFVISADPLIVHINPIY